MDWKNTVFDVLDHGEVELLDMMGNDLSVVNAAKVSFAAQKKELDESAIGLINYLLKNKHATPFEHVLFKFRIKAPIFVTREWMRHRWSSFNEMSMRYHQPNVIEFYIPSRRDFRTQVGKPGAYNFETIKDNAVINETIKQLQTVYYNASSAYDEMIKNGVAKEIARMVLPVAQYTEFIWTVNARSLINFLSLRNDSAAQLEIREYADTIETVFANIMPITYKSFIENERIAI